MKIFNARLIDPASGRDEMGGLSIADGKIADIGPHIQSGDLDAGGKILAPGLIDSRVHLSDPGATHLETLEETLESAVRGGITTVIGLPNTQPVLDRRSSISYLAQRAENAGLARLKLMGALSVGCEGRELAELGRLAQEGAVAFTDGDHGTQSAKLLHQAMAYGRHLERPFVNLPRDNAFAGGQMNAGNLALALGLKGESPLAETLMLQRDLALVAKVGAAYVAGLVSLAESCAMLGDFARPEAIDAATAPHYFLLTEDAVDGYRTFAKVEPPLRTQADRQAVIEAIADGRISMIASDHRPIDADDKRLPFGETHPGMVGLETLLPLSLRLVESGALDLITLLHRLSTGPAQCYGLAGGSLALGGPADLILFDAAAQVVIDRETLGTRATNTSYENFDATGQVLGTWVGGRRVFG